MTPEQMYERAKTDQALGGDGMTLILPKGFKRPPGFPRGEFLADGHDGSKVYRFKPSKILKFLADNGVAGE